MKVTSYLFLALFVSLSLDGFTQQQPEAVTSEWQIISQGKLQKAPRFRNPMITVRFLYENGAQFMNLSLKYMFTDAVFEEAVPVEYFKDERLELHTDKGKHELRAVRYAKARRMNTVAQKIADMRVVFSGDLSFLAYNPVKKFVVHFAQGYQNIDLNPQEAVLLGKAYADFLTTLPTPPPGKLRQGTQPARQQRQSRETDEVGGKKDVDHQQTNRREKESLEELRQRAKKWNK